MEQEGTIVNGSGKHPPDRSAVRQSLPDLPRVDVHIVTWGSASTIVPCIRAVLDQRGFVPGTNLFLRVSDNASQDGTADLIEAEFGSRVILVRHVVNLGFCAGQNAGISAAIADGAAYVMLLNPDVRLEPDALIRLLSAMEEDPSAGWATPRLYRADETLTPVDPLRYDTTGVVMTPALRHFDRASEQLDRGEYEQREYVFGASGAAAMLRASFIADAALPERSSAVQLFDERFFAYREDADLAWRAHWLGWSCLYVPDARGYHVRHVLPERRRSLAPALNAYGVRNRFLMQLNNLSLPLAMSLGIEWIWRNAVVIGGAVLTEPQSRHELWLLLRRLPRALKMRRITLGRKRNTASEVARWFSRTPYAEPALSEHAAVQPIRTITAAVVHYNSGPRTAVLAESLKKEQLELATRGIELRIVVVDNGSADGSLAGLASDGELTIIDPGANLGFGAAVNRAVRDYPADAVLVLNPDVVIPAGTIGRLAAQLDRFSSLGAVAPVLLNGDRSAQHGFTTRRFPTVMSTLAELFMLHRVVPRNPWTARYHLRGNQLLSRYLDGETAPVGPVYPLDRPFVVDQPAGACLLVRGTAFTEVGGFDERFSPAWYEDVDLLLRLRTRGFLAAVLGEARVPHEGGYSLSVIRKARFYEIFYPNMLRFFRLHGSRRELLLLRTAFPVALAARALVTWGAAVCASGETRADRMAAARSLWSLARRSDSLG